MVGMTAMCFEGHLDWFQHSALMDKAAGKISGQVTVTVFVSTQVSISLKCYINVLGFFMETATLFFSVAVPYYIPNDTTGVAEFLSILVSICCCHYCHFRYVRPM